MIVYVTRPDNHELLMGGYRHVEVWTEKPYYSHVPIRRDKAMSDVTGLPYRETGWRDNKENPRGHPFKPLAKQSEIMADRAWELLLWSIIPRSAGIKVEDAFEWLDRCLPGENPESEFLKTNRCSLLHHHGGRELEAQSNVNHKRFLMEVNLKTDECRLIPTRAYFHGLDPIESMDIDEPFASRVYFDDPQYALDEIPF